MIHTTGPPEFGDLAAMNNPAAFQSQHDLVSGKRTLVSPSLKASRKVCMALGSSRKGSKGAQY